MLIGATKARYELKSQLDPTPRAGAPIFFQDFDRRLEQINSELAGDLRGSLYVRDEAEPTFMLAQMPKTTDSATATTDSDSKIEKVVEEFVEVLEDATRGFAKISETSVTTFKWSLATQPTGASVYISRLGEPEIHWTGVSDFHDQTLEYARWSFRVDWNGCSKVESPDPYLQSEIKIQAFKIGCKAR